VLQEVAHRVQSRLRKEDVLARLGGDEFVIMFEQVDSPDAARRIAQLTLDEKIGQLNRAPGGRQRALNSRIDAAQLDLVREGGIDSYLHVAGADFPPEDSQPLRATPFKLASAQQPYESRSTRL